MESDSDVLEGLTPKEQQYFRRSQRMSQRFPHGPSFFSRVNRVVFRLTGGRLGGSLLGVPIGLLTTTGRHSGRIRTVPVVYLEDDSRYLVVASNSGFEDSPAWLLNLQARPDADLQTRSGVEHLVARVVADPEREALWPRLLKHNAMWGAYQSCTERQCAVVALERVHDQESV